MQAENDPSLKWQRLQLHLGKFVDEFVLTEFDVETAWREQAEQRQEQIQEQHLRVQQTIQQKSNESDDCGTSHNAGQATITKDARTPGNPSLLKFTIKSWHLPFASSSTILKWLKSI